MVQKFKRIRANFIAQFYPSRVYTKVLQTDFVKFFAAIVLRSQFKHSAR